MSKSAVEWLLEHDYLIRSTKWPDIVEQAKQMEKEQIIKSAQDNFYAGQDLENGYKLDWNSAEDYYNLTFKSE